MGKRISYEPSGSLATLLFRNAVLQIVTFYIYRFWAKTAVRRYFWHAVRVNGEPFEYTGLGRELFIGFLIVVAALTPLSVAWKVAEIAFAGSPITRVISQIAYLLALSVLITAAGFRARRYRLSRTRWRGIRAGQDGSTWHYIGLSLRWSAASILTLSLAYPWMRTALQKYRFEHTWFGDQRFSFDASARPLLAKWLVVVAATLMPVLALLAHLGNNLPSLAQASASGLPRFLHALAFMDGRLLFFTPLLMILCGGVAYVFYRVAEFRHFASHTQFGTIRLLSELRAPPLIGCLAAFGVTMIVLWAIFALLMTGLIGGLAAARMDSSGAAGLPTMLTILFGALIFVLIMLIMIPLTSILWGVMVKGGILRQICQTLDLSDLAPLEQIAQARDMAPKYGEGLADSFEIGAA